MQSSHKRPAPYKGCRFPCQSQLLSGNRATWQSLSLSPLLLLLGLAAAVESSWVKVETPQVNIFNPLQNRSIRLLYWTLYLINCSAQNIDYAQQISQNLLSIVVGGFAVGLEGLLLHRQLRPHPLPRHSLPPLCWGCPPLCGENNIPCIQKIHLLDVKNFT